MAAALLSKMGYNEEEKVQVKLAFLRMLVRMELDLARMHLISGFFDTYMTLNDQEKYMLKEELRLLDRKEESLLANLQTQWEKDAKQEGILEGKLEGKVEEARKFICKFLQAQYGEASGAMLEQVAQIQEIERLEQLADQLFKVSKYDQAWRLVQEA